MNVLSQNVAGLLAKSASATLAVTEYAIVGALCLVREAQTTRQSRNSTAAAAPAFVEERSSRKTALFAVRRLGSSAMTKIGLLTEHVVRLSAALRSIGSNFQRKVRSAVPAASSSKVDAERVAFQALRDAKTQRSAGWRRTLANEPPRCSSARDAPMQGSRHPFVRLFKARATPRRAAH